MGGAREPRARSTVRPGEEPVFFEGALAWTEPALDASATWRGTAPAISRTLYESPEGNVVWNCVLPSAEADVVCGSKALRGLGYAEHLSMTLPPWRLPIETLRWGRFLVDKRSVVWIDWEKRSGARTWVFVDGKEARGGRVSEEEILFEGGRLRLPQASRLLVRGGRLSHLLRNLRLPLPIPSRLSGVHETKWRTRGILDCAGAPSAEGWAIHEVVRLNG